MMSLWGDAGAVRSASEAGQHSQPVDWECWKAHHTT
jgi:hypothetical protein